MESSNMLQCGLCQERFSSNDDLRVHLEGHASQLFDSDEEAEQNEIKSELDSDEESLDFEYVKEEEQQQGQQENTQADGPEESTSLAPSKAAEKRRTVREGESSSETFMCSKCSYKSTSKQWFKHHMNVMHLNEYKCDHCPKRYPTKGRLASHRREKHEEVDKPKLPEDEFFRKTKKKQGNRKRVLYECLKCTFKNPNRPAIYQHIRGVHRELLDELYRSKGMVLDDAAYHKCTECFFKTLNMCHLKQHIKGVHQKIRDFVCDLCKKDFSEKSNLIQHMKSIHISSDPSNLHKCSICTYKAIQKNQLTRHLNSVHLKIREFTCNLCQKQFSRKSQLQLHIDKHHSEKNMLSCNRGRNCSFRTTDKHELLRHIRRVHVKIKGFSCENCGKWYSSRDGLWSHKKTQHLTIGRLTCDLCQFTTKNKDYMQRHMKRKHLKNR